MARDKLITIRIEGEKREAFNNLAKSQNTDTASLLYDFINQCLDGGIDIKLVTGKGNRIDKIDNQIGSDRIDKLETTTQRLDERVGQISKKLNDWVEAFSDRLNDCDRELSEKIISLEHRLSTLSIQLDSQGDSQQIGDMEPVATVEAVTDKVESATEIDESDYESVTSPIPNQESVEIADTVEPNSIIEPDKGAIGPVPGDSSHLKNQLSEAVDISNRQGLTNAQLSKKKGIPVRTIQNWANKTQKGEKVKSPKYPKFFKQWRLNLDDSLWYEVD